MRQSGIPEITNGTLTLADTEYEVSLPKNCKKILIEARTNAILKFSFIAGESGGLNYKTIKAGAVYWDNNIRINNNLYIQSPTAGTIVEVMAWYGGDDNI
jgi:hypothetical protein